MMITAHDSHLPTIGALRDELTVLRTAQGLLRAVRGNVGDKPDPRYLEAGLTKKRWKKVMEVMDNYHMIARGHPFSRQLDAVPMLLRCLALLTAVWADLGPYVVTNPDNEGRGTGLVREKTWSAVRDFFEFDDSE